MILLSGVINLHILQDSRLYTSVIAICGTGDTCRAWAIDIADESVVELDTRGGNAITITPEYECNDYIVGLLANQTGKVEEYYISKEDFYRSNYDGAFR